MKSSALFIALILILTAQLGWADNLVSRTDRNRMGLNETLNLVLEYDQQVDSRRLDLSALEQDFEILNTSTASQVSIINGRQDVSTRWTLVLLPKRTGTALIPSFQIDGNFSEAITIEVEEGGASAPRSQPLSVELEVSDYSITAMQQLLVTVRLIAAPQLSNLSGDSLVIEGADVTALDQNQYSEVVNGTTWQVNEWTYAVFANQPGTLEIPGQLFSGIIGSTRSIFDALGGSGQRTLARSPSASIEVKPAPTGQYWFPAREVRIEEEWPGSTANTPEFKVGEPITRSIAVIAFAQKPETIPPLNRMASDQFKVYADQPELITQTDEEYLIGVRRESAAIVPTQAGPVTLPEIRIPWWDSDESVWKDAVLPARTVNVLEAESTASLAPPENFADQPLTTSAPNPTPSIFSSVWLWSTILFALLSVILASLLLLRRPSSNRPQPKHSDSHKSQEQQAWNQLQKDLKSHSAQQMRRSLENWCRAAWPAETASPLQRLSKKLSPEAAQQLEELEQSIYGASGQPPEDLGRLRTELKDMRKKSSGSEDPKQPLAPLNPIN